MTFALENIVFFDVETRALPGASLADGDVRTAGAYRYARNARPILLAYAIGDGPVQVVDLFRGGVTDAFPDELYGDGLIYAAWNAAFDRLIMEDFLVVRVEDVIDVMAQAVASNLPPKLQDASRAIGRDGKQVGGKKLIDLFCRADGGTPESHPTEWALFKSYAAQDVEEMRAVYLATTPLPLSAWQEYWASEVINDRGMMVDVPLATAAADMAVQAELQANDDLFRLTRGRVKTVGQHAAIAAWALETAPRGELRAILQPSVDPGELHDEESEEDEAKTSMRRENVVRAIAFLNMLDETEGLTDAEYAVLQVLEIREYGASATPKKFRKIVAQHDGYILKGQYVFNGAAQTGRFSSRGVQVHNLTRSHLGDHELAAIEALTDGVSLEAFARLGKGEPAARKLSLLIRPTFIARPDHTFVWGDWSQIEARFLPWLSDSSGGEDVLGVFRAADADATQPDIYMLAASDIFRVPPREVDKGQRQIGKVAILSLGFGGGVGAFQAMAGNYGVYVDDARAREIVEAWRAANPWARAFWGHYNEPGDASGLWGAANGALAAPGTICPAGRVSLAHAPSILGGTLFMALPCGRLLAYPKIRWEDRELEDIRTGKKEWKRQLTYLKSYGRSALWYGKLAENATQAAAGSLLRRRLVTLQDIAVGHTHDEIICEAPIESASATAIALLKAMTTNDDWNDGLPLAAVTTTSEYYSKALGD